MSQCGREQRYEKQGNETDILRNRAGGGVGSLIGQTSKHMPWQMLETIAKPRTVITFACQNSPDLVNFPGREMVSNFTMIIIRFRTIVQYMYFYCLSLLGLSLSDKWQRRFCLKNIFPQKKLELMEKISCL